MLVEFWMTQMLTRELHDLKNQLIKRQTELSHLQRYASVLGSSDYIGVNNIAGLSPGLLPRASLFAQYANQASYMSATQNLNQARMMGMLPYAGNPMAQYQLEMSAFNNFRQEAVKALKQQESRMLAEKEKEIELEVNAITQEVQMKEAQLKAYKDRAKEEAKEWAPDFG